MKTYTFFRTAVLISFIIIYNGFARPDFRDDEHSEKDSVQYKYFLNKLELQFEQREKEYNESLQAPEKFYERQSALKKWYKEKIGPLPAKTDLNLAITKKQNLKGYSVKWVTFESRPGFHITGLLYIPGKGKAPFPAVYIPCGHAFNGKASEKYQKAARLFAVNGFVVLQADPVCQGERYQYLDSTGKAVTEERMLMHEIYGQQLLLTGSNTLLLELWDNTRCIDLLEQHPLVDKNKIAVAGNSGGGTQVTYLAAFDERIKVIVPSCYISTTESKLKTIGSQDGCQQLWGEGKIGIEEQDFLMLASPKPVLISSATEDFFRLDGARKAFTELKKVYKLLGEPEKVSQVIAEGPHGWHKPLREAAVRWCKKWLLNDSSEVVEPDDIGFFNDEDCKVTKSGQVLTEFEDEKSVSGIISERLADCKVRRKDFLLASGRDQLITAFKRLSGYENPYIKILYTSGDSSVINGYKVKNYLLQRDSLGTFSLPALLITPLNLSTHNNVVVFTGYENNAKHLTEDTTITSELKNGNCVLVLYVSNTGSIKDNGKQRYDNEEFFIAKLPLYEGKTLLAYRTEDIIIAKRFLKDQLHFSNVKLTSAGITVPAAIHAALIDSSFTNLDIQGKTRSWEEIASMKYISNELGNIIPGVLNYYDLPDLLNYISYSTF